MKLEKMPLYGKVRDFVDIFFKSKIMRSAAAVSYYFTLAFFPFLIIIHYFIVSAGIDFSQIESIIGILPKPAISGVTEYMKYVMSTQSSSLLTAAIIVLVTSLSAAVRTLMGSMQEIHEKRRTGIRGFIKSFLQAIVFLFLTYLFLILTVVTRAIMTLIDNKVGTRLYAFTKFEWMPLLMLLIFLLMVMMMLYRGLIKIPKTSNVLFYCSLTVSILLVGISIVFSKFMELSVKYPLVYGSLSFIIIIMIWMYLCANIILGGSVLLKVLTSKNSKSVVSFKGR